jgi:hypothetical protein
MPGTPGPAIADDAGGEGIAGGGAGGIVPVPPMLVTTAPRIIPQPWHDTAVSALSVPQRAHFQFVAMIV